MDFSKHNSSILDFGRKKLFCDVSEFVVDWFVVSVRITAYTWNVVDHCSRCDTCSRYMNPQRLPLSMLRKIHIGYSFTESVTSP